MLGRTVIRSEDGARIRLEELLGSGGQGEVFRAHDGSGPVAVKIYFEHTVTPEQMASIEELAKKKPPSQGFLWPMAMVHEGSRKKCGYVMPLRPANFRDIDDHLARRTDTSMRALLTVGTKLAAAFLDLHSEGLCYRDISCKNVFFDPVNGDVRICDNDNIGPVGVDGGVAGTADFMAPEIFRQECRPSDKTDRYSLAVLLFMMLYVGHPLNGKREAKVRCLDGFAKKRLYGTDPLYVFHPTDDSNAPVQGKHDNLIAFQKIYPKVIKDKFLQSFVEGLVHPDRRVRESEWLDTFFSALDSIWMCSCGAESFYEPSDVFNPKSCWSCMASMTLPPRIKLNTTTLLLTPDTRLLGRHVGDRGSAAQVGKVVPSHTPRGRLGIQNVSTDTWNLIKPDGSVVDVTPMKTVLVANGYKIQFGKATGEMRA